MEGTPANIVLASPIDSASKRISPPPNATFLNIKDCD